MSVSGPLLDVEKINAQYPLHIRRFASGQYLSSLAYYLADLPHCPGSVKVLTEEGSFKDYIVKPFNLKKGMVGYILLPKDKSTKDVKVIFRGTDFSDPKSIAINLERRGPGSASYAQEEENILASLKNAIKEHYPKDDVNDVLDDLTLDVAGHSQGAVLTQLFVNGFLKRRADSKDFDQIKKLNMVALNSPGGPRGLEEEAAFNVYRQIEQNKPLKVIANYGMVGGDAVQVTGFDMIFAHMPPELVELNLLKVDKGFEGAWLKAFYSENGLQVTELWAMFLKLYTGLHGAHSNVNFFAPVDSSGKITVNNNYQYYSNLNPKDVTVILKELEYKAILTQHVFVGFKMFLHYLLEHQEKYTDFSPIGAAKTFFWDTIGNPLSKKVQQWFTASRPKQPELALLTEKTVPHQAQHPLAIETKGKEVLATKTASNLLPSFLRYTHDSLQNLRQGYGIMERLHPSKERFFF